MTLNSLNASPARTSTLNCVRLCDGRDGIRALLGVTVVRPSPPPSAEQPTDSQLSTINSQPVLDFIASTAAIDRYGEIIEPDGWELANYRKNPVFQNAHRYGDILFTLGKAIEVGVQEISADRKALVIRVEFAVDVNPVARIAYGLYSGGFLKGVSVGFIALRWENGSEKTEWSRRYIQQELLEVSAVAIPANAEALALGLKSGAFTKADVAETLDILRLSMAEPSMASPARTSQLSPLTSQLLLARELRTIMRA